MVLNRKAKNSMIPNGIFLIKITPTKEKDSIEKFPYTLSKLFHLKKIETLCTFNMNKYLKNINGIFFGYYGSRLSYVGYIHVMF